MKILLSLIALYSTLSLCKYYDTLPKGVHMAIYRNIKTSEISSTYDNKNQNSPLSFTIEADTKFLTELDSGDILGNLKEISAEAYDILNLGTYHMDIKANVNADVLGMAYGITDKLTLYAGIPIYKAEVKVNYKRLKSNNYAEVQNILLADKNNPQAQALGATVGELADFDISSIQSIFQDELGYEPLGSWSGSGLGDIETGFILQLFNEKKWGSAFSAGAVLPTGYVDDPDIIQDFGFGDGQYDVFAEFGFGYSISPEIQIDNFARITYQFASEKELRVPYSQQASTISDRKAVFREKLGTKIDYTALAEWKINDWFEFSPSYLINYQSKATYDSPFTQANSFLAHNSDSVSHSIRLSSTLTTITPFLKKKFLAPMQFKFHYQKLIDGRNIPDSDRVEFEFRMMF